LPCRNFFQFEETMVKRIMDAANQHNMKADYRYVASLFDDVGDYSAVNGLA
jgi:hypothetical protein